MGEASRVIRNLKANIITELSNDIHHDNKERGWWDDSYGPKPVSDKYVIPTKISLAHSELSEGLEGFRKNMMDDHLPLRKMFEVELADAMIRIMDIAGYMGYDLGSAILEKLEYNAVRKDHTREERAKSGGKSV